MSHSVTASVSRSQSDSTTSTLLLCGLVAAPFWAVVVAVQVATRPGFDITRHPASLLSLGDLGWVQVTNFLVSGLLSIAFAAGGWRLLHGSLAGTWGPLLLGGWGLGFIGAGIFTANPMNGFPPRAATPPENAHDVLHLVFFLVAFISLVAATLVFARRDIANGHRVWAAWSVLAGALFLVGEVWFVASGAQPGAGFLAFWFAVHICWLWQWLLAWRLVSLQRSASQWSANE